MLLQGGEGVSRLAHNQEIVGASPTPATISRRKPRHSKKLSQWFTDPVLAERIVDWACIESDDVVLEPSAGDGALVRPLAAICEVHALEIDKRFAGQLLALTPNVWVGDFLKLEPQDGPVFDVAVMNPPYEKGQDSAHVAHALKFASRVVANVPLSILVGERNHARLWVSHTLSRVAALKKRPAYSGTKQGGRRDMCVVEILAGKHDIEPTFEQWS